MPKCERCANIMKLLEETNEKIDQVALHKNGAVNIDMTKTLKAMFYEKVLELFEGAK